MRRKKQPKPVDAEELEDAIVRAIVERFGDRPLDIDTALRAVQQVGFKLRQAYVFRDSKQPLRIA